MTATQTAPDVRADQSADFACQYVSFRIDGQLLGVPVYSVQEVLNPQGITRTPRARREVAGLLNLRGQIVTAVNLRRRLGLPDLNNQLESLNVVVRHRGESYSILVDEVGDVIDVTGQTLESMPPTLDEHWRKLTSGVFRLDDGLFVILNIAAILTFD